MKATKIASALRLCRTGLPYFRFYKTTEILYNNRTNCLNIEDKNAKNRS